MQQNGLLRNGRIDVPLDWLDAPPRRKRPWPRSRGLWVPVLATLVTGSYLLLLGWFILWLVGRV